MKLSNQDRGCWNCPRRNVSMRTASNSKHVVSRGWNFSRRHKRGSDWRAVEASSTDVETAPLLSYQDFVSLGLATTLARPFHRHYLEIMIASSIRFLRLVFFCPE